MTYHRVLELFKELSEVPRGSGNCRGISGFIKNFAEEKGCTAVQDEALNVFAAKAAAPGYEKNTTLVFQAHMDMVCVADRGVDHDFTGDAIEIKEKDGWLYAPGTTLGADDGLGVAVMLGLMEDGSPSGRLEFIFTADEETDMSGAKAFDCGKVTGRKLINLDNEEEGSLIVSSAGISDLRMQFPYEALKTGEAHIPERLYQIRVDGFLGGHSGMDIHLPRLNSVRVIMAIIEKLSACAGFQLYAVAAGSHMNAIPKSASCLFAVENAEEIEKWLPAFTEDLKQTEPGAEVHFTREKADGPFNPYTTEGVHKLIDLTDSLRHGVLAMDKHEEGLVETSVNLARIYETQQCLEIWCCFRSSIDSEMEKGRQQLEKLATGYGGRLVTAFFETGWERNPRSTLVPYVVKCYRETLHEEPRVEGIHAGLECGCWSRKIPDADIISMGPTLVHPHTTGERAELASLEKYVILTDRIVQNTAELK